MIRPFRFTAAAAAAAVLVSLTAAHSTDAEVIQSKLGGINVEPLVKLDSPYGMEYLPDGRLLITEKPGKLRIFADGKLSEPIAGVPEVHYKGQGGMLDVAVDPNFKDNGVIYLSYTEPAEQQPSGAKDEGDPRLGPNFKGEDTVLKGGAVARAKLDGMQVSDVKVIWRQTPKTIGRGHFACRMAFSPDGKTLFITSGERQRSEPAQDMNSNLGKVVRIHPDGSIPTDNPYVNKPGNLADIWTSGNRNPLGFAFHPETGQLWLNEMGPKGGDELNLIQPGKNYGWPLVAVEAKHYNDAAIPPHDSKPEFEKPAYAWTPVISPSGMMFYTGDKFTKWKNHAFIGGLSSQAVIRVALDGQKVTDQEQIKFGRRIRDLIQAPDGAILLATDGPKGELLRLTPAAGSAGE